jgi:hypothetical protein
MKIWGKVILLFFDLFLYSELFSQSTHTTPNFQFAFELGEYNILQYRANIRKEPTRNSDIIAILSINDKIEILENSLVKEKINGVLAFWYKIKYGNIIGYTFGGNIAREALVADIDNNGINDYFYSRTSEIFERYPNNDNILDSYNDIIIYINDKKINTNELHGENNTHIYNVCVFTLRNGYVLMQLIHRFNFPSGFVDWFWVNQNGTIEYRGRGIGDR